ncbi:DUF6542 domain-containing protein [Nocardioides pantholopis]|uniref:DUF6542 domain-containing protein n=1 Tax=Nocardioides pantholopis TaxID=2483798 RepID=UPI000F075318|nr:DUF6542 domain-containing protein [Nocardioides pantholopis]
MSQGRTLWEQGHEPGRGVVALALALGLSAAVLDVWLGGDLGWLFDLAFVAASIAAALLVRVSDFFTVGVLPPLVMVTVFVLLAATTPGAIAHPQDGAVQAVVSGLSHHSLALLVGYALCLGCLAIRHRVLVQGRPLITPRSAPGRPRPDAAPPGSPPTSR